MKKKRNTGSDREVNNKLDRGTHRVPTVSCLSFVCMFFSFFFFYYIISFLLMTCFFLFLFFSCFSFLFPIVYEDYSRLMTSYKVSSYSFENGQNVSQETASKMNFK